MKKKTVIILGSVVVVCGAFSSLFVDWPVDFSGASGDIAKATRFSREQASEKLTNMEELLQNDSAFKDGIVAAQVVMQTRAVQFASLVDMSNEVAGDIPAFAEVLKDMNAASKMVENVNNSLAEAGDDLNAALVGEERPDLAQNTINASLAYTTLQKQNKLATRFIETTDKYLETAKANDQLKFVRDQWLEYQQMTAALEGDKESAEALAKKGNLLSGEKALSALQKFGLANQVSILCCSHLAQSMNVETKLASSIEPQVLGRKLRCRRCQLGVTCRLVRLRPFSAVLSVRPLRMFQVMLLPVRLLRVWQMLRWPVSMPIRLPVSMPIRLPVSMLIRLPVSMLIRLPVSMLIRLPMSVQRRLPIRHLRWAREVRSVCQPLIWAPLAMWFLLSTK